MSETPPALATGDLAGVLGGYVLLRTDRTGRVFCFAEGGGVSHLEASCAVGSEGKVVVGSYGAPVSMDKHMFSRQIVDVFESLDGKDNGGVSLIKTLLLHCQPL